MSVSVSHLVSMARAGQAIQRIDKIDTLDCLGEISGFKSGVVAYGPPLTVAEQNALAHRAIKVQRGRC
ncbi:hypothetical protein JI58_07125 [Marinosulfonomonas sp. PRT-SC04]|nr:hypothetical protein JI58_07125 [Marinosulfonomonas sp. PRT-SC04]